MSLSVDDLLARVGEEKEFTFPVAGETLRANVLADASAVMALERKVTQIKKTVEKRPAPDWKPFLPADEGVIRMAVYCEELMIEPKMSFLDGLKMAKKAGVLFLQIGSAVLEKATGTAYVNEADAIDDAKNG